MGRSIIIFLTCKLAMITRHLWTSNWTTIDSCRCVEARCAFFSLLFIIIIKKKPRRALHRLDGRYHWRRFSSRFAYWNSDECCCDLTIFDDLLTKQCTAAFWRQCHISVITPILQCFFLAVSNVAYFGRYLECS